MGGPPIVVYLMALSHRAAVVRASSIVYFMFAATLSLLLMVWKGLIDREILLWSLASVPVLIAGNYAGNWGFSRFGAASPSHHRTGDAVRAGGAADREGAGCVVAAASHCSPAGAVLVCLTRARCALDCRRRRFDAAVGRVAMRGTGGSAARWISRISASSAACRLRSCVRKRCAVISTSPCSVARLPASARRRACVSSRQTGYRRIEPQLHRGRDLVDVLPARSRRTHERLDDCPLVDRDGRRDPDHPIADRPAPASGALAPAVGTLRRPSGLPSQPDLLGQRGPCLAHSSAPPSDSRAAGPTSRDTAAASACGRSSGAASAWRSSCRPPGR